MSKALEVREHNQVAIVDRGDVDMQVSTAKQYPRSVTTCLQQAIALATVTREMAEACIYTLPRGGKSITGPSIRLAEIMASSWGNLRVEGKVIGEDGDFIVARGTAWDMETNVLFSADVKRRIVDKYGKRFKVDMIGVTGNAAVSIAVRNALLRVVPRAVVDQVYEHARQLAVGDVRSLGERRALALKKLAAFGVTEDRVLLKLGRAGVEDVTLKDIEKLIGLYNSIDSEDVTPEDAFPEVPKDDPKEHKIEKKEEEKKAEPELPPPPVDDVPHEWPTEKEQPEPEPKPDGLTLASVRAMAQADFVPLAKVKTWEIEEGIIEDDKRTHTEKRLGVVVDRIKNFVNQAG